MSIVITLQALYMIKIFMLKLNLPIIYSLTSKLSISFYQIYTII
jgi:hypothetical protein